MTNVFSLKFIDKIIGQYLCKLLPRPQLNLFHGYLHILLIRPGGIGDAVLLLPAIETLARCLPGIKIEVLAEQRNAEVFIWCPDVSKIWRYDHITDLICVLRQKYDVVIDTEQWYRLSAVVARLTRAPRIIGFAGNNRERMLTDVIPYDLTRYEASSFYSLLAPLGVDQKFTGLTRLALSQTAINQSLALLRPISDQPFVALFPGASVPEKVWPIERFVSVAAFARDAGFVPVIVGGKEEYAAGEQIVANLGGINLAGKTTLSAAAALLARAAALVSGDSGLLHIAAVVDIPIVALFGPSDWKKWGPQGKKTRILSSPISCAPCSKYGTIANCNEIRCMDMISVESVTTALVELLAPVSEQIRPASTD